MKKKLLAWFTASALLCAVAGAEPAESAYTADLPSEEIYALEERLSALGYLQGTCDEVFDENTRLAIESFQQANGLDMTGEPDDATLSALYANMPVTKQGYLEAFAQKYAEMTPLKNGSISDQVVEMQKRLREYGYFNNECDGVFGDATQTALERFQAVNGLTATGEADGATMMRLMEGTPIRWEDYLVEMSAAAGDSGLNVYVLQKNLRAMGYFQGDCTGNFGDLTQRAVLQFQAENNLEQTGAADAATWEVLYSGMAVTLRSSDILQTGDVGEAVVQLQQRLQELGYFTREATGEFTTGTETAVRLFQMAAGLDVTGDADEETLSRLNAQDAPAIGDAAVQQRYQALLDGREAGTFAAIAEQASRMLGVAFAEADDALYPGFSFVQYVCVAAGMPITHAEELTRLADQRAEDVSHIDAGSIVTFRNVSGENVSILMTISAGDGKVIYATAAGGWVVLSYMNQMDCSNVYIWGERAEAAE